MILLSTHHHDKTVSSEENNSKSEIILHYNKTKGAVDIGDKMTRGYSCVRGTRRWPFRIFMEMIDIAALNAYILYTQRFPEWQKNNRSRRKVFLTELAFGLCQENMEQRIRNPYGLQPDIKEALKTCGFEFQPNSDVAVSSSELATSHRCQDCRRDKIGKQDFAA